VSLNKGSGGGCGGEEEERWGYWKGKPINLSNRLFEAVIIGEGRFGDGGVGWVTVVVGRKRRGGVIGREQL